MLNVFLVILGVFGTINADVLNITLASSTPGQGTVQINVDGTWGTICDDNVGRLETKVICGMTNTKADVAVLVSQGVFNPGSGNILIDELSCRGSEKSVTDCTYTADHDCDHSEDVAVICDSGSAPMRLVNGDQTTGRLEIQINGQWGTVCDDEFTSNSARVACRSMGLPWQHAYTSSFGQGTGEIWLDDVMCQGNEASLLNCNMSAVADHDCGHDEDVGLICTDAEPKFQVRLVNGATPTQGRVEVNINGPWGTVCDDSWDDLDAQVVCNMLGYTNGTPRAYGNAYFGMGTGGIYMDEVECLGNEASIADCTYGGFGNHDCDHSEDAGVSCSGAQNVPVRLVNGPDATSGRVEVFVNNQWGTVCDDNFDDREARVICHGLGYSGTAVALGNARYGQGTGSIYMDELACSGSENNIGDCRFDGFGINDCDHSEDASVICNAGSSNVTVRLVDGKNSHEGRLEVLYNGAWGTVCDDYFNSNAAAAVCKMLGLPFSDAEAVSNAFFGQGSGSIWLDNVRCTTQDNDINSCRHSPFGVNNCDHSEDVGVRCGGLVSSPIRLVGGVGPFEGRLEIFHNGAWGTVCSDMFDSLDAQVVCNILGYPSTNPVVTSNFGQGTGTIWLTDMHCTGNETSLDVCYRGSWGSTSGCDHSKDVGVICRNHGIQCYHCDGLTDPKSCNETITCAAGEACEEAAYISNGQTTYSLTCQSQLVCDAFQSVSAIGKREEVKRQASGQTLRIRCCTTPLCNNDLIDLNPHGGGNHGGTSGCQDKPGTDCNALDLINICDSVNSAKLMCPKHCGLCT